MRNIAAILKRIATQVIGDTFYIGNVRFERVGETDFLIGEGYASIPVSEVIAAIKADTFFAGYPIPPHEFADNEFRLMRTMPDLHWSKS